MPMRVVEMFDSIDGEGVRAGELAVFVRLAGCNLRCSYCDTEYALHRSAGEEMPLQEVLSRILGYGLKNVTVTGGEPLLCAECLPLVQALCAKGCSVNIETNGSLDVAPYAIPGTIICMDWKTPSSGEEDRMCSANLDLLRPQDVLKFVIAEEDFPCVERILSSHDLPCWVYLSPVFGRVEPEKIVAFMKYLHGKGLRTDRLRVQLQLHKYIWPPSARGV